MTRKPVPDPCLADVTEWPHTLEGRIDVVDCGWSQGPEPFEQMGKAEILRSYTAAAGLELADGNSISFSIDGAVLVPSMIWPEEFDTGALFRVSLALSDQAVGPVAIDGKFIYYQGYEAVRIERAD